jgi:hypothetical protein
MQALRRAQFPHRRRCARAARAPSSAASSTGAPSAAAPPAALELVPKGGAATRHKQMRCNKGGAATRHEQMRCNKGGAATRHKQMRCNKGGAATRHKQMRCNKGGAATRHEQHQQHRVSWRERIPPHPETARTAQPPRQLPTAYRCTATPPTHPCPRTTTHVRLHSSRFESIRVDSTGVPVLLEQVVQPINRLAAALVASAPEPQLAGSAPLAVARACAVRHRYK